MIFQNPLTVRPLPSDSDTKGSLTVHLKKSPKWSEKNIGQNFAIS